MIAAGGWAAAVARARLPLRLAAPTRGSGGGGHRGRRAAYAGAASVGVAAPAYVAFTRSDEGDKGDERLLLSPLLPVLAYPLAPLAAQSLAPLAAQSLAHLASSGRDALDVVGDALLGGGGRNSDSPPPPSYPGEQPPYPHTRRRATDGQRAIAYIAGVNVAVYGLWKLADFGLADERSLSRWLMTSATHLRERWPRGLVTALTSSWSHRDLWHLGLNMMGLWSFTPRLIDGPSTPQHPKMGLTEFMAFYTATGWLSGMASNAFSLAVRSGIPSLGASGAIFAVMGYYSYAFPDHRLLVFFVLETDAVTAFWGISALNAYWVAKAAVAARSGGAVRAPMFDGVAHLAGSALGVAWYKYKRHAEEAKHNVW